MIKLPQKLYLENLEAGQLYLHVYGKQGIKRTYSQPSVSTGSTSMNSTKHKWKIFKGKIPESSKKQNLNLLQPINYLHSIYIVLSFISNLEMI